MLHTKSNHLTVQTWFWGYSFFSTGFKTPDSIVFLNLVLLTHYYFVVRCSVSVKNHTVIACVTFVSDNAVTKHSLLVRPTQLKCKLYFGSRHYLITPFTTDSNNSRNVDIVKVKGQTTTTSLITKVNKIIIETKDNCWNI